MLKFNNAKTFAIGEAMIEMAPIGEGTYRRNFAGDTFNTVWHMSQVAGSRSPVALLTKVGTDTTSDAFVDEIEADGLDVSSIGRVSGRTMGLYLIDVDGVERSFQYWRDQSAARLLADNGDWLDAKLEGAGLIHFSGITLAILTPEARCVLVASIKRARRLGARVSFDPNVRPRLWSSPEEARMAISQVNGLTDIALPSFEDEQKLWGDKTPDDTIARLRDFGVNEIVVKNGAAPAIAWTGVDQVSIPTPPVENIQDTSGAGDAFNAGYFVARLRGSEPAAAIPFGQKMAAEVIGHFGARIPKGRIPDLASLDTT